MSSLELPFEINKDIYALYYASDQFNVSVKSYYEGENIPEETVEPVMF